jgi:methionine biosynthesis protein MetW
MTQLELVHPAPMEHDAPQPRPDHDVIARMVRDNASVLDVGCGDGALMTLLARECGARARGLEPDRAAVRRCVSRGLSVVRGDAESDLAEFPSGSFDYVVFSHTLQHLRRPEAALREAARIGDRVIVSIVNSGRWNARMRLLLRGRLTTDAADDALHCYTVRDFVGIAREARLAIESAVPLSRGHQGSPFAKTLWRANLFADEVVFLLAS